MAVKKGGMSSGKSKVTKKGGTKKKGCK